MNFLAHIYLSGDDQSIMIGNFIADSIKGKKYLNYPDQIQKGILLHRAIDSFSDEHPIARQSARRLRKKYRHYSPVIVDIIYDHFLAKNWKKYHSKNLEIYVSDFYNLLENNFEDLPERIQRMMPYMISDNWLLSYQTIEGISKILSQMNVRTKGRSKMNLAIMDLEAHYNTFEDEFSNFFSELIVFSEEKLKTL